MNRKFKSLLKINIIINGDMLESNCHVAINANAYITVYGIITILIFSCKKVLHNTV